MSGRLALGPGGHGGRRTARGPDRDAAKAAKASDGQLLGFAEANRLTGYHRLHWPELDKLLRDGPGSGLREADRQVYNGSRYYMARKLTGERRLTPTDVWPWLLTCGPGIVPVHDRTDLVPPGAGWRLPG